MRRFERSLVLLFAPVLFLALHGAARSDGLPDYVLSTAECQPCELLATPAGQGTSFAEAGCSITVQLLDPMGESIANYPYQDIWVGLPLHEPQSICHWSSAMAHADTNTDQNGRTIISLSRLPAGGHESGGLYVLVSGMALVGSAPLPIRYRSPDLNADLRVDLVDVSEFAIDFVDPSAPQRDRSDFDFNGSINLADIGTLALHLGESCP